MVTKAQYIHPEKERLAAGIAMGILLVTFSMLFATLFLGYAVYRIRADVWPPMGMPRISLFYPILSTATILLSSFTYYRFESLFFNRAPVKKMMNWLVLTLVLGICFAFFQWLVWQNLWQQGLYVSTGIFPSMLHGFTWIHLAHMALAVFLLGILCWRIPKTDFNVTDENKVVHYGHFWHFLTVVWVAMFFALFVL